MSVGTDVILDPADLETSFAPGRNFANKLWNAGRFILTNLDGPTRPLAGHANALRANELTLADKWIIARCDATIRAATESYEKFRLNDAASAVFHFLWSDFADWYIEAIKPRLYGDAPGGDVARAIALRTFDVALRLLHPIMPFVTETLWQRIPGRKEGAWLAAAAWPAPDRRAGDAKAERGFPLVQELVGAIRAIRAEYDVSPGKAVRVFVQHPGNAASAAFKAESGTVRRLAKVSELGFGESSDTVGGYAVLSDGTGVFVPLGDAIDVGRECARLGDEIARLEQLIGSQEKKLGNEQFVARAPAAVVEKEREKLTSWREQAGTLAEKRTRLGC